MSVIDIYLMPMKVLFQLFILTDMDKNFYQYNL